MLKVSLDTIRVPLIPRFSAPPPLTLTVGGSQYAGYCKLLQVLIIAVHNKG